MTERVAYKPPEEIRSAKKRAWLTAFAENGSIQDSCAAVGKDGIHHSTYYQWREDDPAFVDAVEEARRVFVERLEVEAFRRAYHGVRRLKFHGRTGTPLIDPDTRKPYVEVEYSDTLLMFLIKKHDPTYRERHEVKVTPERIGAETERILRLVTHPNGNGDGAA